MATKKVENEEKLVSIETEKVEGTATTVTKEVEKKGFLTKVKEKVKEFGDTKPGKITKGVLLVGTGILIGKYKYGCEQEATYEVTEYYDLSTKDSSSDAEQTI